MGELVQAGDICEMVASWQGHEHGSGGIPIIGSRYLATTSEDYNRLRLSVCYSDL
jgi:hypothetical protein